MSPPPHLLRLDHVFVKVQDEDATTSSVPSDTLHVWLGVPNDPFAFQHFVTAPASHGRVSLVASGTTGGPATLDTTKGYWCVWATSDLGVTHGWQRTTGFGYPLPTKWEGSTLILPNWVTIVLRTFNLSQSVTDAQIASRVTSDAAAFYADVKVRFQQDAQPPPASPRSPWVLKSWRSGTTNRLSLAENTPNDGIQRDVIFPPFDPQPNLGAAPFVATTHAGRTVTVVWCEIFWNLANVGGMTFMRGVNIDVGQTFRRSTHNGTIFMNATPALPPTYPLAHELGHALLGEMGLGTNNLSDAATRTRVVAFMRRFDVPSVAPQSGNLATNTGMDDMGPDSHYHGSSNLMNTTGGSELLPWQVAVLRASPECTNQGS